MSWTKHFQRIVLINLPERTDRFMQSLEELEKWDIPFELINATKCENGADGLRQTMDDLFKDCIMRGIENMLVFEDDVQFLNDVTGTMNEVVKQLPSNYKILYLGSQCTRQLTGFFSPNLLPVKGAFATHAASYSLRCMKEMVGRICAPIDNWIVSEVQEGGDCYQTYPILATQRPGYSDICRNEMSWIPFIEPRFNQRIAELNSRP